MTKTLVTTVVACLAAQAANASLVSVANPLNRPVVSTVTGGNLISLTDLQTIITTTANTVKAGVFDAEIPAGAPNTSGNIATAEANYAVPDFTLTGATRYARNDANFVASTTSGGRYGFVNTTETWTLSADVPGEVVTHFGVTFMQARVGADVTSVVATFTDDSTETWTSTLAAPSSNTAPIAVNWEFVGFSAPAGLGIKSIRVNEVATGDWVAFDDMMFVVGTPVPEPASALLGAAGLGLVLRRRRRG